VVAMVKLVPFDRTHLPRVGPWFDHPEVQSRLGGPEWAARELDLVHKTPGTEYRGALVTGRFNWVAFDANEAVGLAGGETYDRWTSYGGESPAGPIVHEAIELPTMALHYVVDPSRWRRGYCTAILEATLARPEVASVRVFEAGIELDNVASARCVERVGFVRRAQEPDWEGMLHFILLR
jgi:RimJ/RimL family protein N-acetyltransferase